MLQAMQNILQEVEEGIHIVDRNGVTIAYNEAMEKIEGLEADNVIGRHLLEVFPNWSQENSTLLMAMTHQKSVRQKMQSYLNLKGKRITTVNTTFPIFDGNTLIGAVEISKNFTDVTHMSEKILDLQAKLINPEKFKFQVRTHYTFDHMIGRSEAFLEAIRIARRAAETSSSVLIHGDTGTGKELFAQSIHSASARWDKPFIGQNCAAIPDTLLESILFGSVKGSFTGAQDRPGLFEQANGGTLFLDEINSMSEELQAKLLRVLQESYVRRVGGQNDIKINVRIIAATNEDPFELMQSGTFRKDLFYRLNVIYIKIPTLNQRKDDIPLLVEHFIRMFNEALGKDVWMLSGEVAQWFRDYHWPGNVRELQNFIEAAMNMVTDEHVIGREHLPSHIAEFLRGQTRVHREVTLRGSQSLAEYVQSIERTEIESAMKTHNGNISKAAESLGISRQNLQYKLKQQGAAVKSNK
jgi:arginine utilization regulatory protein